jgi:hypothetical protein
MNARLTLYIADDDHLAAEKPSATDEFGDDNIAKPTPTGSSSKSSDQAQEGEEEGGNQVREDEPVGSDEADSNVTTRPGRSGESSNKASDDDDDDEQPENIEAEPEEEDEQEDNAPDVTTSPEVRGAIGVQVAGSGMMTPAATSPVTPRRTLRPRLFKKNYMTGKPKEE